MDIKSRRSGMDGIRVASKSIPYQKTRTPLVILPPIKNQSPVQQRMLDGVRVAKKSDTDSIGMVLWKRIKTTVSSVRVLLGSIRSRLPGAFSLKKFSFFLSPRKAFYLSLIGGVAFGVFVTAFTFKLFDRGVSAQSVPAPIVAESTATNTPSVDETLREGELVSPDVSQEDVFLEYFSESAEEEYRTKLTDMVRGYPIEPMLPYIFEKDRTVAAFLVGIAKKESNWGKRVPVLDGQDCFNYWGYRGVRRLMGTGGHTCFNSRKDAVDTVARRIEKLVYSEQLNTPEKMILWKCGFSCQGHSRESVKKWISDVDIYFSQLEDEGY